MWVMQTLLFDRGSKANKWGKFSGVRSDRAKCVSNKRRLEKDHNNPGKANWLTGRKGMSLRFEADTLWLFAKSNSKLLKYFGRFKRKAGKQLCSYHIFTWLNFIWRRDQADQNLPHSRRRRDANFRLVPHRHRGQRRKVVIKRSYISRKEEFTKVSQLVLNLRP